MERGNFSDLKSQIGISTRKDPIMFHPTCKAVACLAFLAVGSLAQAEPSRVEVQQLVLRQEGQPQNPRRVEVQLPRQRGGGQEARLSDYWLGLECFPVDAVLRSHLNLGEWEGLVVEQIVPDSPAAKADLKRHDVIVKAGGKPVKAVSDLMGAVDEAKENQLVLEIIRAGKPMTMKATPVKRPEPQDVLQRVPQRRMDEYRQLFERLQGEQPDNFRYRILGPGAVLPGRDLPKGLTVTITRTGGEPAKIIVKKDDQSWEITDKELDKLPDDVRPHVERMLGRGGAALALPAVPVPPGVPSPPGRPEIRRFDGPADRQLKEMMDQLDKLRRQMEDLQRNVPKDPKPAQGESRT
jgi:hypothetical protein